MSRLLLALLCLSRVVAFAHTLPISYLVVWCDAQYAHFELTLNPFELSFFSELDLNKDGQFDPTELKQSEAEVAAKIATCLKVQVGGKLVRPEVAGLMSDQDSHHLTWRAHYRVNARDQPLSIESDLSTITSGSHVTQLTLLRQGQRQLAQLDAQSPRAIFASMVQNQNTAAATGARTPSWAFGSLLLLLALPGMAIFGGVFWFILRGIRNLPEADSHSVQTFVSNSL